MNANLSVKVICFYTENTPYQQEVKRLIDSCHNWDLDYDIAAKPSFGDWGKNLLLKPLVIQEKMKAYQCPLFWVDADAVFLKKPDFSQFLSCDVAVRMMPLFHDRPDYAVNTASIFFNNTPNAHEVIDQWCRIAKKGLEEGSIDPFLEQRSFYEIIKEKKDLNVLQMPLSYCKIFDIDSFFIDDHEVVIEQTQASRRYKDKV